MKLLYNYIVKTKLLTIFITNIGIFILITILIKIKNTIINLH
jgi:hypothetical protein